VESDRGGCDHLYQDWKASVAKVDPDLVVMVAGPWEVLDQIVDGKQVAPGSAAYDRALSDATERAIDILAARGARVVFMDVPCFGPSGTRGDAERADPERRAAVNRVLRSVAARDPRMHVLTWSTFLCPGNTFTAQLQGVTIRPDGVHFDPDGAKVVWAWLGPKLLALADAAHRARDVQS
jgi:hypothetical protein